MLKHLKKGIFAIFFITFTVQSQQPTDCVDAVVVCGNSEINLDVNGIGTQEVSGLNSCSSGENNSLWLKVTVVTDGTLAFTLTPQSTAITEDYDFFIFGPTQDCSNLGFAIRCSTTNPQAAGQGNNLTGLSTNESESSEGPGQDGNSFVSAINALAGETYFIVIDRPIGNSPFSLEWTGTAEFSSPPNNELGNPQALNLEKCDTVEPYNDGITTFDIEENTNNIIGNQTNVQVTYHESESDANIGINAITSPYNNISNSQEVYAKLTNTVTDCFEIIPFTLTVNSGPNFATPSDFEICDDYTDNDAFNGQTTFNLTNKNNEILNGQDASSINISYHETLTQAENNTNPLNNQFYNTTPDEQTIFVRIEDATNQVCFSTTPLTLRILETPLSNNISLFQCDEDGISDGITTFNLLQAVNDITNGNNNVFTTFFETFSDAENDINAITSPESYSSSAQTIFAQVKDNNSLCYSIAEIALEVSATQIQDFIAPIVCDELNSEDGLNTFDLSNYTQDIHDINGISFPIVYYETYEDALLEQNPLPSIFNNTTSYSQTIFARAENNNACYGISEVQLNIEPLPNLEDDETLLYCLNTYPQTITLNSGVIGNSNNYTYSWSNDEQTESIQINEPGTYTVTVTNSVQCSKTRTITVEASNIATIDNINVVDISENNSITVITSGEGIYEYALLNEDGTIYANYQTSNTFNNIEAGIYTVSIRDTKNDCGIVSESVAVIGYPKFFTPNGDGYNDRWNIKGISNTFQPNTKLKIFDRYGKLLKQINPLGEGWDGSFNGEIMPTDDYWFSVDLQDGRTFRSHFTLKR
ncbi:T9SS type B sorting domain-containing protein [Mangrovimonas spongiae]|uniref:Gliding motility-associated C-terminal domain-containing protein n=1 Tax=Mangrovimonas spongiae TaxID=2494697 RepID=A0A3R9NZ29_9FLAO|nr:T9SS type B sorting domain-containing protein [Mangrovimonas spongiae]RSK40712.1 gliding motility-associated C-terminal domain-containing protein [Mangrovimonas spongiae]